MGGGVSLRAHQGGLQGTNLFCPPCRFRLGIAEGFDFRIVVTWGSQLRFSAAQSCAPPGRTVLRYSLGGRQVLQDCEVFKCQMHTAPRKPKAGPAFRSDQVEAKAHDCPTTNISEPMLRMTCGTIVAPADDHEHT